MVETVQRKSQFCISADCRDSWPTGGSGDINYNPFTAARFVATSTATSTFAGPIVNGQNHVLGSAVTFRVATTTKDGDFTNLNQAYAALPSTGGTIEIGCGTFNITAPGLLLDKSSTLIKGQGRCTVLSYNASTTPTAIRMTDSTQRTNIVFQDMLISQSNDLGGGTCVNFTKMTLSHFTRVDCSNSQIGWIATSTDTHYNTIRESRVNVSGDGSYAVYLGNDTQSTAIGNTFENIRLVGDSKTISYFINAHNTKCYGCFSETQPLVGVELGPFSNDSKLDVYLEQNTTNLKFSGASQGTVITGFIADADTANIAGQDMAQGVTIDARVQYQPIKTYLSGQSSTKYGMGIGTTTNANLLTLEATSTSNSFNLMQLSNPSATANSPTGILFSNPAGNVNTGRIWCNPGSSFANTTCNFDVADSSKTLQSRFKIDVNGVVSFNNFSATSTTATSSIAGNFDVNGFTDLATTTTSMLNGVVVVDGVHYAKTSTGVQNALNDCAATASLGCTKVKLTSGTTTMATSISIPSNVTLECDGWNTILYPSPQARINIDGKSKVTIRDCMIDQSGITTSDLQLNMGIYVSDSSDVLIDHVRVKDA